MSVNSAPTTATDLVFTPPAGEEALHHYFYVRAVNVLGQDGYFTDLASATDFRFENTSMPVTISMGVATMDAESMEAQALIKRADDRLYEAKSSGRNRVCA